MPLRGRLGIGLMITARAIVIIYMKGANAPFAASHSFRSCVLKNDSISQKSWDRKKRTSRMNNKAILTFDDNSVSQKNRSKLKNYTPFHKATSKEFSYYSIMSLIEDRLFEKKLYETS